MSLRKDRPSLFYVGIFVFVLLIAAVFVITPYLRSHTLLRLGDGVFQANVANFGDAWQSDQEKTYELPSEKARVTVYDIEARWTVNMDNRPGSHDLVWLDKDKKVVHIIKNASSESIPSAVFRPIEPAKYRIELRAGTVDQKTITIDSMADFDDSDVVKENIK